MMNYNKTLVEIEKQKLRVPKKNTEVGNTPVLLVGGIFVFLIVLMLIS